MLFGSKYPKKIRFKPFSDGDYMNFTVSPLFPITDGL